ncbi:uncharacterized mitochondrial protein-like protein [Tanacetum coccineum]
MNQFCEMKGILRQFNVARTPQQNRVAERRNRTLIEAVRTMLVDSKLPTTFWAEAVNTACYEKPKKVIHALKDRSWIEAMEQELLQFKLQEVWTLVDLPNGKRYKGTHPEEGLTMMKSLLLCACARYQVNPKVSHLHAMKKIFGYIKGQPKFGLWYPKDSPFYLVEYIDSDYARAILDRKFYDRSGGLILYQAYGNLYAMTGRKAHLLEDKQIPSVGVFDEVFSTWMAFGGNTRDLGSFGEETDEITDLHQIHEEILFSERGDGVAGIKRRRRDPSSDGVRDLVTASGRGRLNEDL